MSDGTFVHEALFYRGPEEYLAGTVPFIDECLRANQPVLVAVPTANLVLLTDALGSRATRVRLFDACKVGSNPGRIIPWVYHGFAAEADPHVRVNILGEPVFPGRTAEEYPACVQHEAACNLVFAGRPSRALCPYDVSNLDLHMVEDAHATHPLLVQTGSRRTSAEFVDPRAVIEAFNTPLPDLGPPALSLDFDAATIGDVRRAVAQQAAYAGMEAERRTALHDAVAELAANSVEHGGGSGRLTLYRQPDCIVCDISDSGWIADPLAGRIQAAPGESPPGLALVHLLCDLVRTHTTPTGTTTRLYMRLPGPIG
jgi:anti-sigma regulatory factor (Ser/Thr protein kinase)